MDRGDPPPRATAESKAEPKKPVPTDGGVAPLVGDELSSPSGDATGQGAHFDGTSPETPQDASSQQTPWHQLLPPEGLPEDVVPSPLLSDGAAVVGHESSTDAVAHDGIPFPVGAHDVAIFASAPIVDGTPVEFVREEFTQESARDMTLAPDQQYVSPPEPVFVDPCKELAPPRTEPSEDERVEAVEARKEIPTPFDWPPGIELPVADTKIVRAPQWESVPAAPTPDEHEADQQGVVQPVTTAAHHAAILSAPPAVDEPAPSPVQRAGYDWPSAKSIGVRAAKVTAIVFSAWFGLVLFLIIVYRFVNPPFSTLMALQWVSGTSINQQWVPLEAMSPNLMRAVIASEDGRFCSHWGIDFAEIAAAIRRSPNGTPRGASTITMQVAKNLFLWPAKSYVRKVIEVPLTYAIELFWPKRRILEVYLNIAEWGPGIFGAEAASQAHFGQSAEELSARQGAQLAVALPNPFTRDPGDPGPWAARRASLIQRLAARAPEEARCVVGDD